MIADVAFLHPAIGKAVEERTFETVPQVVLGDAGNAGVVARGVP